MIPSAAIEIEDLSFSYRNRSALDAVTLAVPRATIFAFLGPNGCGKTTLFRLLSTLLPLQRGVARVLGFDIRSQTMSVRSRLGVVFQSPSLDKKLTVRENIRHQAALYGLSGSPLFQREKEMISRLGLSDVVDERTETLSGGMRRRVELAKSLIHRPDLLLLDEPSTGLDPRARLELWAILQELRDEYQVSIAMTTHLLEEADKADQIAILDRGRLVVSGRPSDLRATVGGDSITIQASDATSLASEIQQQFGVAAVTIDGAVRLEQANGHQLIPRLAEAFSNRILSITLGKPTLEDVFIAKTGHRFQLATEDVTHG